MHKIGPSSFLSYGQNDQKTFIFRMRQKVVPNDPMYIIYKDYPAGLKGISASSLLRVWKGFRVFH